MTVEPFHFTDLDGVEHSLPLTIPSGALRKVRKMDNLDAAYTLLEACASPETLAATDLMDSVQVLRITGEWMQGLTAPQSSSSPN